jgi:hypothetical protein
VYASSTYHRAIGLTVALIVTLGVSSAHHEGIADPCAATLDLAERALSDLRQIVPPPPGWTVRTECGPSQFGGLTDPDQRSVTLWPEAVDDYQFVRWAYVHEVGHAYDLEHGAGRRESWFAVRSIPESQSWYGNRDHRSDLSVEVWQSTPAEDFADAFAYCVLGPDYSWIWRSELGPPPTPAQCSVTEYVTGVPTLP